MKNLYDFDYYERGVETGKSGYSNFRWIPELTIPMCHTMINLLGITDHHTILDFGCAKGYVVKAMRLLHKNAWGVDISEYAISKADAGVKQYLFLNNPELHNSEPYDWVISKDVLEHIPYENLKQVLDNIRSIGKNVFCAVPLGNGTSYNIPAYELDVTHIIREDMNWWCDRFKESGFEVVFKETKIKNLKENYSDYKNGNGFFILK